MQSQVVHLRPHHATPRETDDALFFFCSGILPSSFSFILLRYVSPSRVARRFPFFPPFSWLRKVGILLADGRSGPWGYDIVGEKGETYICTAYIFLSHHPPSPRSLSATYRSRGPRGTVETGLDRSKNASIMHEGLGSGNETGPPKTR